MQHSEFKIGGIFRCGGRLWRCTDIAMRTIVAIRIDRVEVGGSPALRRTLSGVAAEAEGWFRGPPYAVVESVFDENDIEGAHWGRERKTHERARADPSVPLAVSGADRRRLAKRRVTASTGS